MMLKTKLTVIFSLSTALVLTGTVSAHEEDDSMRFHRVGQFSDIDTNDDGKVSRDEYLDYESDSRRYDREKREENWEDMIDKFDYNEDDHITTAEVEEFVDERLAEVQDKLGKMKLFRGLDFDMDLDGRDFVFDFDGHDFRGSFDGEAFAERMEGLHERIERTLEKLDDMDFHDFDGDFAFSFGPSFEIKRGHRFHSDLDDNEDGVISEDEFLNNRTELFERLDRNGDGVLDEDELDRHSFRDDFSFRWKDKDDEDED